MDAGARLRKPRELMMTDGSKEREKRFPMSLGGEERRQLSKERHTQDRKAGRREGSWFEDALRIIRFWRPLRKPADINISSLADGEDRGRDSQSWVVQW